MPLPGAGPGSLPPFQALRQILRSWEDLKEDLNDLSGDGGEGAAAEFAATKKKVIDLRREARSLLRDHPNNEKMWGLAEKFNLTVPTKSDDDEEEGGKKDTGGGGSGGGGGNNNNDVNLPGLPGKQGADYVLKKGPNGKYYAVYDYKIKGKTIKVSWRINPKDFDAYGITKADFGHLTKEQMKRMEVFGNADELRGKSKKHPFEQAIEEQIAFLGPDSNVLKNREVMQTILAGIMENHSQARILADLESTKWFKKRTSWQAQWELDMNPAQKKSMIAQTKNRMQAQLETLYGADWISHVEDGQLDQWAERISKGRYGLGGDLEGSYNIWLYRQTQKAIKNPETPAAIDYNEGEQADQNSLADPKNMFEKIRQQAIEWLGPSAIPHQELMDKWAKDLAYGDKGEQDYLDYLKKRKQSLYAYLDDDETWQDAASSYRAIAEQQLGKTLNWDDKLFQSFIKTDAEGNPLNDGTTRMSAWDFQKAARLDPRFNGSQLASEKYGGLSTKLDSLFRGTPY